MCTTFQQVRLGSLELESDDLEGTETGLCSLLKKLSSYKVTWVVVTALTVLICGALADPVLCSSSQECQQNHLKDQDLQVYSGAISAALASVLMHELASVILTNNTAKKAIDAQECFKDVWLVLFFLFLLFPCIFNFKIGILLCSWRFIFAAATISRKSFPTSRSR